MNPTPTILQRLLRTALRIAILLFAGVPRLRNDDLPAGPVVLFAKHSSHFDVLVLWAAADAALQKRLRPVGAADYWGRTPWLKWAAEWVLSAILIDRHPAPGERPLHDAEHALKDGACLLIFPEGTRLTRHRVGPFKSGIYWLSKHNPDVALVPTYVANAGRVLPKGDWLPTPTNCHVVTGAPLRVEPDELRPAFSTRAERAVGALMSPDVVEVDDDTGIAAPASPTLAALSSPRSPA